MTSAWPHTPPTWPFQLHWLPKGFLPPTTRTLSPHPVARCLGFGVWWGELEPKRVTFKIGSSPDLFSPGSFSPLLFQLLAVSSFSLSCSELEGKAKSHSSESLLPPHDTVLLPKAPHPMLRSQNNLTDPAPAEPFPPLAAGHQPQVCEKIYLIFELSTSLEINLGNC